MESDRENERNLKNSTSFVRYSLNCINSTAMPFNGAQIKYNAKWRSVVKLNVPYHFVHLFAKYLLIFFYYCRSSEFSISFFFFNQSCIVRIQLNLVKKKNSILRQISTQKHWPKFRVTIHYIGIYIFAHNKWWCQSCRIIERFLFEICLLQANKYDF